MFQERLRIAQDQPTNLLSICLRAVQSFFYKIYDFFEKSFGISESIEQKIKYQKFLSNLNKNKNEEKKLAQKTLIKEFAHAIEEQIKINPNDDLVDAASIIIRLNNASALNELYYEISTFRAFVVDTERLKQQIAEMKDDVVFYPHVRSYLNRIDNQIQSLSYIDLIARYFGPQKGYLYGCYHSVFEKLPYNHPEPNHLHEQNPFPIPIVGNNEEPVLLEQQAPQPLLHNNYQYAQQKARRHIEAICSIVQLAHESQIISATGQPLEEVTQRLRAS